MASIESGCGIGVAVGSGVDVRVSVGAGAGEAVAVGAGSIGRARGETGFEGVPQAETRDTIRSEIRLRVVVLPIPVFYMTILRADLARLSPAALRQRYLSVVPHGRGEFSPNGFAAA
jgi:hypothetical protein